MKEIDRGTSNAISSWATAASCMALTLCFATHFYVANAADPAPLQDFCVAANDPKSAVFINGRFCKNPIKVETNDFVYKGFDKPGDTNNTLGATAMLIDINRFAAVNTLGVSIARVDFGPYGLNTPHFHPLASEMFAVLEGTLYAGFVATDNKLYDTIIKKGDIIVFPQGLIHFQLNLGETNAVVIAAFGSQNPGRVNIADSLFGTPILDEVLTKAFQVSERVIIEHRARFSTNDVSDARKSILRLLSQVS